MLSKVPNQGNNGILVGVNYSTVEKQITDWTGNDARSEDTSSKSSIRYYQGTPRNQQEFYTQVSPVADD